jgi:hypothetical protein
MLSPLGQMKKERLSTREKEEVVQQNKTQYYSRTRAVTSNNLKPTEHSVDRVNPYSSDPTRPPIPPRPPSNRI